MSTYDHGLVILSPDAPTLICLVTSGNDSIMIQNVGNAQVFVGGPDVAASGPRQGISIPAGEIVPLPSVGGHRNQLYGITSALPQSVVYLMPQTT